MYQIGEELWQVSFSNLRITLGTLNQQGKIVARAVDKLLQGKYKLIPYITSYIKIKFRTLKSQDNDIEDIRKDFDYTQIRKYCKSGKQYA